MRLMTKGRLAVTAMIDLALRTDRGPVPLAAIGRRQGISLSYLEQLFGDLRRGGLVRSTRGPGGGYTLDRPAADITIADIVRAVDELADEPGTGSSADTADGHAAAGLWEGLNETMLAHLRSISLQVLVQEQRDRGISLKDDAPVQRAPLRAPVVEQRTGPNSVFALASTAAFSDVRWP
jgi:Rrf2 family iron-sulfur cluster assembly transcriptional regulator